MPVDGIVNGGTEPARPKAPKAQRFKPSSSFSSSFELVEVQDVPDDEVLNDVSFMARKISYQYYWEC